MFLVVSVSAPAFAQQAAKEAEIRRSVPYASMLRENPRLTLLEYEAAVRKLAAELVATERRNVVQAPQAYSPYRSYSSPSPDPYSSWSLPSTRTPARTTGSTYDWQSDNLYTWSRRSNGTTDVQGSNLRTGSMWNTTIKADGSMTGWDKNLNYWTYDRRSGTYMNLGTGQICVGEGVARVCTGGR